MKKLQILLTLLMFTCASQSAQAMFSRDQLSTQALALRDQVKDYIVLHPTEAKAFGVTAGILATAALYKYSTRVITLNDLSERHQAVLLGACRGFRIPNKKTFKRAILEEQLQLHPREAIDWHIAPAYTVYRNTSFGKSLTKQIMNNWTDSWPAFYEDNRKTLQFKKNFTLEQIMWNNQKIVDIAWFLHASTPQYNPGNILIVADENQKLFDYLHAYVTALNANEYAKNYAFKQASPEKIDKDLQGKDVYTIHLGKNFFIGKAPGDFPDISFSRLNNNQTFIKCGKHNYGWLERIKQIIRLLPFIHKFFPIKPITKVEITKETLQSALNC